MILISHRGNLDGKNPDRENDISYILEALQKGYQCEIDVWHSTTYGWYLGHDIPQYKTDETFLMNPGLWIHAKNIDALHKLSELGVNYFWHEEDDYTLTSKGYIWAYPGRGVPQGSKSICVLPEINNQNVDNFLGVCSDYIRDYG